MLRLIILLLGSTNFVFGQIISFSMSTGPSIPFGNFSSKNAAKSAVFMDYNPKNVVVGFSRKKSGFAILGWNSNASIDFLFKQKIGMSFSGGIQKNGTNFKKLEIFFDEYNKGPGSVPVHIYQPAFKFQYFDLTVFYNFKYRKINTQLGPVLGWCTTDFPNYEKEYIVNGHSIIFTHRITEKDLRSTKYGFQVRQIYDINKRLNIGLQASFSFTDYKYTISLKAVGIDPATYNDILRIKALNLGIKAGYNF